VAEFKISDLFQITGRGEALAGDIMSGEISCGDLILIDRACSLVIKSVEFIDFRDGSFKTGLMLGELDAGNREILKSMNSKIVSILRGNTCN